MNFLKDKFLIAALALSVAGAGVYGQDVDAYKVSADLSSKKVAFHYDAALHDERAVFIGYDISGTPYKFENTEYNREILANAFKMWKAEGSYAGSGQETYSETDIVNVAKDEIIVSPDGKKIYFHWSGDYQANDYSRRNFAYHMDDVWANGFAISLKEGYDLSGLRLVLDDSTNALEISGGAHEGIFRVKVDYINTFHNIRNEYTLRNTFNHEEKVPLTIPKMSLNETAFKVGQKINYSKVISGVDDNFSTIDDSAVDTSSAGKKEGVVKFEYVGADFIYSFGVPVSVNVEAAPEVKNEVIDDASVPQAPNTGFQNTAGAGLIVLSLLGLSTWFVVKGK